MAKHVPFGKSLGRSSDVLPSTEHSSLALMLTATSTPPMKTMPSLGSSLRMGKLPVMMNCCSSYASHMGSKRQARSRMFRQGQAGLGNTPVAGGRDSTISSSGQVLGNTSLQPKPLILTSSMAPGTMSPSGLDLSSGVPGLSPLSSDPRGPHMRRSCLSEQPSGPVCTVPPTFGTTQKTLCLH